jgi:hypothetical protein
MVHQSVLCLVEDVFSFFCFGYVLIFFCSSLRNGNFVVSLFFTSMRFFQCIVPRMQCGGTFPFVVLDIIMTYWRIDAPTGYTASLFSNNKEYCSTPWRHLRRASCDASAGRVQPQTVSARRPSASADRPQAATAPKRRLPTTAVRPCWLLRCRN